MKQLLIGLLLLLAYPSLAQSSARFDATQLLYGHYLHEVHTPDSLARITREIQEMTQPQGEGPSAAYSSPGRYRLLYFYTFGWEELLSQPRAPFDRKFINQGLGKVFTRREIFRLFSLHGKDSTVLQKFPPVSEREDVYNCRWTPVSFNSRYLIMRNANSYPNGNTTSWYYERIYYFERVN